MAFVFRAPFRFNVVTQGKEHIFNNHLLPLQHALPVLRHSHSEIWPSVFLLLCLCLLVLIKVRAFPRVVKIIQSTYNPQTLQQLEREDTNQMRLYTIALNLFFLFNLAFLIFKINAIYGFVLNGSGHFTQFLFFGLLVVLMFGLRFVSNKLLGLFSHGEKVLGDYESSSGLINQACGLFIFPWIILVEFANAFNPLVFICGALITLAASVLIKWYRGIIVCLIQERVGLLQIFAYFCGLEILPAIVMVKYVIETF